MTETKRVYQLVADQLRQIIHSGPYAAGSRLPAERELAQQLGISRPSLREALIALEIDGVVEIRSGSGIYVLNTDPPGLAARALGESPLELMQARAVIECAIVAQAAARITSEMLAELDQDILTMKHEIAAGRRPLEHDRRFHISLAASAGNSILTDLVTRLFDERHSPISERMQGRTESPETWQSAIEEHEAILQSLKARDPVAAQAAMHAHLVASRQRWLEG